MALEDQMDYTGDEEEATGSHCKEGSKGTLE